MGSTMVRVPDALLSDRRLGKSAKLLWLVWALDAADKPAASAPRPGRLQALSGLARHTVVRGLQQLQAAGWPAPTPGYAPTGGPAGGPPTGAPTCGPGDGPGGSARGGQDEGAQVPGDLLQDRRVSAQARLLYASLQRTPGFRDPTGQFTYAQLSQLTGLSPNTLKRAVRALQEAGWLTTAQTNKFSPIHFVLRNPVAERYEELIAQVRWRLSKAPFMGEALMREYLTLLVDTDEYDDNASPAFLTNPFTGEEMQFDRYYPPGVAFEFNGPQHYGPTDRYPSEDEVRRQQARDYIKQGISASRGIHLAVVHPKDLTLDGIRQKVQDRLPLRQLAGYEPVIAYLEKVSRGYLRKARTALSRGVRGRG